MINYAMKAWIASLFVCVIVAAYVRRPVPQNFDMGFWLYTKNNRQFEEIISPGYLGKQFISGAKTVFIIHGYRNTGKLDWIARMKDELLKLRGLINVIVVNWQRGAFSSYAQSAENTQTVGGKAGDLIQRLKETKRVKYDDFHVIGHGLGAHAAGLTGKRIQYLTGRKVGRVTGLDPAGYDFAIADKTDLLTEEDGAFVDVIHTNVMSALSFGMPIGHADFYPNGGRKQPGCSIYLVDCSHMRATTLFTNSINQCPYVTHQCPSGSVIPGARMGYHASRSLRGKYCLDTASSAPYCSKSKTI